MEREQIRALIKDAYNFISDEHEVKLDMSNSTPELHKYASGGFDRSDDRIVIAVDHFQETLNNKIINQIIHELFDEYNQLYTEINYIVWTLFHEAGHFITKNAVSPIDRRFEKTNFNNTHYQTPMEKTRAYRKLEVERLADEKAFELLSAYLKNKKGEKKDE